MTTIHPASYTAAQRRYQVHTARAARRVAGVFGAHLWGLGDLPTDITTSLSTPGQGAPLTPTANDDTAIPTGPGAATGTPDDVVAPTTQGALTAIGIASLYGGAIGAVASASLIGASRGMLAAGGLSAFGVALAYATTGQKMPALGFGVGAAGAVGLAIYLAVRSRRARA